MIKQLANEAGIILSSNFRLNIDVQLIKKKPRQAHFYACRGGERYVNDQYKSPGDLVVRKVENAFGFPDVFFSSRMLAVKITVLVFFYPFVGMFGKEAFLLAF